MKFRTLFCTFCAIGPFVIFAAEVDFSHTLKLGMRGDEVRALQQVLNSDPDTRVAEHGDGSLGNETNYFGNATKRALIKFQEKYRGEILTPVGLVSGTGILGEKTRLKLMAVRREIGARKSFATTDATTATNTSVGVSPASPHVEQGDVFVTALSRYSGTPGTVVTMSGEGFTAADNTIYFGSVHAVEHASSQGGQMITFAIPSMPKGVYHISVKNTRGESDREAFFVVTDGVTPEPKIESVTYTASKDIVVHGGGFTVAGNMVRAGTGIYEGVSSSDGKMITVPLATTFGSVKNLPTATIFTSAPKEVKRISFPVEVIVVNENGVSNNKNFTLEL